MVVGVMRVPSILKLACVAAPRTQTVSPSTRPGVDLTDHIHRHMAQRREKGDRPEQQRRPTRDRHAGFDEMLYTANMGWARAECIGTSLRS